MKQAKLEKRERIARILAAALELATRKGGHYAHTTRDAIAAEAGMSFALVTYHTKTMEQLRRDVMREAIRVECLPVIAQGLVARDRIAMTKATPEQRARALQSFGG